MQIQPIQGLAAIKGINEREARPTVKLEQGQLEGVKRVEIDLRSHTTGRELPADAIQHNSARMFFSPDINHTLDTLLSGPSEQVQDAVYGLFEKNFFSGDSSLTDEDRAGLLEMGLSQAKLLADKFMNASDAAVFTDTVKLLGALAKTRGVDSGTGAITYAELPQKPIGAPDDYVNAGEMMKQFDPEGYRKMQAAILSGDNAGGMLIAFAKKLRQNPEWSKEYLQDRQAFMEGLHNTKLPNRFEEASTDSLADFVSDMNRLLDEAYESGSSLLKENLRSFAALIEGI
ncbi:hypothetical protein D3P09_26620 [Paenibacillus pinisoli]|uniref:Uncharacterized protein n=1 Tax=Paenibacillus pinisoli TaxID=1276110 RepID=A0A3A6P9T8_9BACL|nr:hypothetical protein [Paenibacillus pinisoli]RJX36635.1 hypothetical protein D3P09_26620 [Paenibacillus pinisoli]